MKMESADVKYSWPKALNISQREHVTIFRHEKPVAVLMSWNDYNKITEANKLTESNELTESDDFRYASLAEEAMKVESSLRYRREYKGKTTECFSIKFSKQAEEFIFKLYISDNCFVSILNAICDRRTPCKVANTPFYKKEVDGFLVIYTISGLDIFLAYIDDMSHTRK
jgi:PHD/YefM family antitoxin component YafN of YafNO toxin-antitoxin module